MDVLLGRNRKISKLKTLAKLAVSRTAIFRNQRAVRCSHARLDVIELLKLGQQERALLRVEHVIKERSMLDAFALIGGYCIALKENASLMRKNNECPEELKEAVSSLIFAASRCGEFPELQQIRKMFVRRYGKEFASHAVELPGKFGVNTEFMQKLSTRRPNLESRLRILKEIASEDGITLHLQIAKTAEENYNVDHEEKHSSPNLHDPISRKDNHTLLEEKHEEKFHEAITSPLTSPHKYKDVVDAAEDAFKSAAYAAAAARAAVQLSRSESGVPDQDDDASFPVGRLDQ